MIGRLGWLEVRLYSQMMWQTGLVRGEAVLTK